MTEEEFLRQYNPDKYPKPSLTADIILFSRGKEGDLQVLLIRRKNHPFMGRWAFPGGFADKGEALEQSAARELEEETGLTGIPVHLVNVYSAPGRDPRGWVVSVAYCATVDKNRLKAEAADDASDAEWFTVRYTKDGITGIGNSTTTLSRDGRGFFLAFDHDRILSDALFGYAHLHHV